MKEQEMGSTSHRNGFVRGGDATTMKSIYHPIAGKKQTSSSSRTFSSDQIRIVLASVVVISVIFNVTVDVQMHLSRQLGSERGERDLRFLPSSSLQSRVEQPKLVWLMSFPNSGTSFTSRLVRDATLTDSASNYGDETPSGQQGFLLPVYEDQPEGPFWINDEGSFLEHTDYILTKTHCGMRCTLCPPEKYAESTYSFRRRCLTTKWMEVQDDGSLQRVFSEYKPDNLAKAVHLIRDPFDNIVSRYHLEQQIPNRTAKDFDKSREGFRAYCASVENIHAASEKKMIFLDDEILRLMSTVPCHEDFLRYIEWHNLAFSTVNDLELETYVLHYDWFTTRYNATVKELLDFLELEQRAEPTPFVKGLSYDYFTAEEREALKEAFQVMASPRTWSHMSQYFASADSVGTMR